MPVAANEAAVPTPETEAVKAFAPAVGLEVGVQETTPLEFVVDEAQLATEAPEVVVAQVTVMPAPTALPWVSLTVACKALLRAEPAVTLWLLEAVTTLIEAGLPGMPVAEKEAAVPTPETEAVNVLVPTIELRVGVQVAIPLEFVVEVAQPLIEAPLVEVAQVTAMPELTALPFTSSTKACRVLLRAEPAAVL